MSSNFTVIYDACVLYPAPLRDLLMRLALTDLFRARWSRDIHDEWMRNVLKNRPEIKPEQLERTRDLMDSNVRDCLVTGYEPFIETIGLPDQDDRHVVAAAIKSGASLIVTFNLKDFPESVLAPLEIEAQYPDEFISHQIDLNPAKVCEAASKHRRGLKNPPKSVDDYLDTLLKQGLVETVKQLREWKIAL